MPDQSSVEQRVAKMNRFAGFSNDQIAQIVANSRHLTIPEHWAFIAEQTPADKAYLILDGEVSVRRHGEEIAQLGAGELIGEMALVDHRLRSATVVALTPLEVLHFTADDVAELQKANPQFAAALQASSDERRPE